MVFRQQAALEGELAILELTGYSDRLEHLSPEELATAEPALAGPFAGGILATPERHVRPESLCAGLAEAVRKLGGQILESTTVESLVFENNQVKVVATSVGPIEADAVVIATGAEAGRLAAQAGSQLPMQAGKGYSITIDNPQTRVNTPLYITESKLAITPFAGALRVSGTMELSGINSDIDPRRLSALEQAAERDMPGVFEGGSREPWVGMRPITPDGLPILGALPGRDTVYVASGHQMLGMTLGPSTGKALAGLILNNDPGVDLSAFAPGRF
jgi:D-amino-acid dehydrogenase